MGSAWAVMADVLLPGHTSTSFGETYCEFDNTVMYYMLSYDSTKANTYSSYLQGQVNRTGIWFQRLVSDALMRNEGGRVVSSPTH
ncbi:hypothetical protein F5B19DRAFT_451144 [Rostrohypoxylon terebratum]|nr:hypothetical protein F5B19DRAFT_451144 [Rostrohypoxylon terebratum]